MQSVFKIMSQTMVMFSCPILGILFVFFMSFFFYIYFFFFLLAFCIILRDENVLIFLMLSNCQRDIILAIINHVG